MSRTRNDETCNSDIYRNGEVVGVFNLSRAEAEELCERLTEETGLFHDWHRVAGRARVLREKQ